MSHAVEISSGREALLPPEPDCRGRSACAALQELEVFKL